jgi:hypothetical protein
VNRTTSAWIDIWGARHPDRQYVVDDINERFEEALNNRPKTAHNVAIISFLAAVVSGAIGGFSIANDFADWEKSTGSRLRLRGTGFLLVASGIIAAGIFVASIRHDHRSMEYYAELEDIQESFCDGSEEARKVCAAHFVIDSYEFIKAILIKVLVAHGERFPLA